MHLPAIGSLIFLALVVVGLLVRKLRGAHGNEANVKVSDIEMVFAKLNAAQRDGSFAAFVFTPSPGNSPENAVNLQFSVENGCVGFDWVLLAPANLRDQNRFGEFAKARGYSVSERETNGVKYLRIEQGGSLPRLCEAVTSEMYGLSATSDIDLITEGFSWL